jgi:hypothetical protein
MAVVSRERQLCRQAGDRALLVSTTAAVAWTLLSLAFYVPLLTLRVVAVNDMLDSELVYNVAVGALWRGDPSIAHAFLNGHVSPLALERLTQPLMLLYALLPPFLAFVANDFVVRAVAARGSFLLLREIDVPPLHRHLLAAMFAFGIENSVLGLSIAGIPLVLFLLTRPQNIKRNAVLALVGWNMAIYLSGIFVVAVLPFFQKFIIRRSMDGPFWFGVACYTVGLLLGCAGLILLVLLPHPVWHRAEWGVIGPAVWPFPWHLTGRPLLPLFILAALVGWRSKRVWALGGFGLFILLWYQVFRLPWFQLHRAGEIQMDRLFFLWPVVLMLIVAFAVRATSKFGRALLAIATAAGCLAAMTVQHHIRELGRIMLGRSERYPPIERYYHAAWYRDAHIDAPVLSVGTDPMAAPFNRVRSIDGFFNLYPLSYKHAFQRVYNGPSISTWGSKLYAQRGANFCAARALGARYVVSAVPLPLPQIRGGELKLYGIEC